MREHLIEQDRKSMVENDNFWKFSDSLIKNSEIIKKYYYLIISSENVQWLSIRTIVVVHQLVSSLSDCVGFEWLMLSDC
mgnify:CR=1 FL=1